MVFVDMKKCAKCNLLVCLGGFNRDGRTKDGLHSECTRCQAFGIRDLCLCGSVKLKRSGSCRACSNRNTARGRALQDGREVCSCGKKKARKSELCFSCRKAIRGSAHPNFRGGRNINGNGYVQILNHDHPRADGKGYVLEHIVIMEAALNRSLVPGETVHHKNTVRHDNELSNLELWFKPQPGGARASDLVAYVLQNHMHQTEDGWQLRRVPDV